MFLCTEIFSFSYTTIYTPNSGFWLLLWFIALFSSFLNTTIGTTTIVHNDRLIICIFSSVQFSRLVVSNSLWPHELQHARPPCPSSTPGVHSNSRPSSRWCHPAISSFVIPFSSCPQSLPVSEYFPISQLFSWGGQSTGVSASASVLPKNSQDILVLY